ncbi:Wzz/FepE/Etk N-terminal domain-containing protein [Marinobacter sp.]|uniref:Wzz/FepE/Etk N-terminal domain-containing protein n=1 Tax=Marinobacter sp. TaxID=50741 RepID=UPI00198A14FA|nr:Wzz/FepE/Etk N-terminal domain-containing protein [Marinobacter sp.]MBD3655370.1 lipopolysaccharide biosynthesis protein [Marinobacter sp.]
MSNTLDNRREYNDEISLVDLAATFVRRRRVFYVTFLVVTLLAVVYALMTPAKYEYVSLLQLAEDGEGEYLEEPGAVVATLENRWIPEEAATFTQINERRLPFKVKVYNPKDTGLIKLSTETTEQQATLVTELHTSLINSVIERQQQLIERSRKVLESRIASQGKVVESLQALGSSENSATALASAIQKQAELESDMESLKPAQSLVTSRQSTDGKGPSKALVVVLGALLGVMGGVFLAFFSEFIVLVRDSLVNPQVE